MLVDEHPTAEQLTAFGLGKLDDAEFTALEAHLAECETCRCALETQAADSFVALARAVRLDRTSAEEGARAVSPDAPTCAITAPASTEVPPELADHPRYRILGLIGVGGMGAVFKAEHQLMHRVVALKVINRRLVANPALVERFTREVIAAGNLSHPNIVHYHDAEHIGDTHFLVMEYVEGTNLAKLMAQTGPLPIAQACDFIRQAALGLQHAFERGMVHRDIKPQNLMVTRARCQESGQQVVKILDFGLARLAQETEPTPIEPAADTLAAEQLKDTPSGTLTQIGAVMGTPDYIAPEQARDAHAADIRSDIYSLGCTLYDLLTGNPPFPDGTVMQKVIAHLEQAPRPVIELRSDVPAELTHILEKMLAKDPDKRYQTPAEVALALAPIAKTLGEPERQRGAAAPVEPVPAEPMASFWWLVSRVILCGAYLGVLVGIFTMNLGILMLPHCFGLWTMQSAFLAASVVSAPLIIAYVCVTLARQRAVPSMGARRPLGFALAAFLVVDAGALAAVFYPPVQDFAQTVIRIATNKGVLEIETDDMDLEITITQAGKEVGSAVVVNRRTKRTIELKAVDGEITAKEIGQDGMEVKSTTQFQLTRGGKVTLTARMLLANAPKSADRTTRLLAAFGPPERPITRDGVSNDEGGWRIEAANSRSVRLFDVEKPSADDCLLIYRAKLKTEKLQGKAYLEMWCAFPGEGESFSKGLLNPVSGTTEWSTYEIPFRLEKGERPERVKLNVAIEGKGTVWIKDITLNKFPLPPFKERPPMARGTDQELIQGTWKPVRADVNGMPAPEAMFKTLNPHIAIMGAQVVWKLGPNTLPNFEGEITLDPSKSPKAINMIVFDKANRERKVLLGIYKLEGDTLEICSALNPDAPADRPREFKSVAKGFVGHIVLQRAKSGANPRDPAFQPLFNGKNLDGWVAYADKKGADAKSAWEINGKLLFCRGEPSSYLRTVKSYKNYVLQMDFRYPRPSGPKAHNGVLLHLNGPDEVWPNCIQVQLDGKDTGSVFPMPGAKSTVLKVQDKARLRGEWNQLTIASRDGTVEVQMNGESLGSVTGCEPSAGHIGLQVKGSEIHFRDVRIRELPNSPESTFQPLFNGKDLDGWDGDKAIWKFQNDLLIGTPPPGGVVDNTFLVSKKRYKDFELKFQVRLKDGAGNSGVQVRSETIPGDPPFRMRGPQADIADGYWGSLWGEHVPEQSGHMFKQAPPDLVNRVLKFNDFNDYYVKCVGKRVTIKVNGLTTVDEEFAAISDAGLLGWQMHFGKLAPKEVLFRAIQIRELTPSKERND